MRINLSHVVDDLEAFLIGTLAECISKLVTDLGGVHGKNEADPVHSCNENLDQKNIAFDEQPPLRHKDSKKG